MNRSLKVISKTENLKEIRAFLEETLAAFSLNDEEKNLMILAVDEICANVIIHSHSTDPDKKLEVRFYDSPEGFTFEILDSGLPFDHTTLQENDLKAMIREKRKGGLGLMLVRRIMDSIELKKENSLTIYRLFKKMRTC